MDTINDNRNIGIYSGKTPGVGPDTDSVEIRLESQGSNVTPNLRLRHTRLIYKVPSTSNITGAALDVKFNSPINWDESSLHTLLLDNSSGPLVTNFTFSADYLLKDNNPTNSRVITVPVGSRVSLYLSIISGKLYVRTAVNSDTVIFG